MNRITRITYTFVTLYLLSVTIPPSILSDETGTVYNDQVLAPEVAHFQKISEPGVDAKGDLNLSIPLLTIPGRDGLDFPLVARYSSGIKVNQPASWIGLGWSLDIGSITRQPLGGFDDPGGNNKNYQVDYALGATYRDSINTQPDVYIANFNGQSTRLITPNDANPAYFFAPYHEDVHEDWPCSLTDYDEKRAFVPSPWKPWKICFDIDDSQIDGYSIGVYNNLGLVPAETREDYKSFTITVEDGTQYEFGMPTLSDARFPHEQTSGDPGVYKYRFVSTWRLTEIRSPKYRGEIESTNSGGWVKITYRYDDEHDIYTSYDTVAKSIFSQLTYPYKIETPTHYAIFYISERDDKNLINTRSPSGVEKVHRELDKIVLYKKGSPDKKVSLVKFDTGYAEDSMFSKSKLTGIHFRGYDENGDSTSAPPYTFEYYDIEKSWSDVAGDHMINLWKLDYLDDFGFFYDKDDSLNKGWMHSLKKIKYPEGGRHEIVYENDQIATNALSFDFKLFRNESEPGSYLPYRIDDTTGTFAATNQGGARVDYILKYDGYNSASPDTIRYEYGIGGGYYSNIPETWVRKKYENALYGAMCFSGERGQASIYYDIVEKINPDGSRILTRYNLGAGNDMHVVPHSMILRYNYDSNWLVMMTENTTWQWGEINSREYYPAGSLRMVKQENYTYEFKGITRTDLDVDLSSYPPEDKISQVIYCSDYIPEDSTYHQMSFYLHFPSKQLTQYHECYDDTTDYTPNFEKIVSNIYNFNKYDDGTLLRRKIEKLDYRIGSEYYRVTDYTYAHEITSNDVYACMLKNNMRNQLVQTTVRDSSDGQSYVVSSTATTWKKFITVGMPDTIYVPDKEFQWKSDSPVRLDSFANLNFNNPTETPTWRKTKQYANYDAFGNPTEIIDANGNTTTIEWSDSTNHAGAVIDNIEDELGHVTSYKYHPTTLDLKSVTDPNNMATIYSYDKLHRLKTIQTNDSTLASYQYNYSSYSDSFVTNNPNGITTTTYFSADDQGQSAVYFDGLGRSIQTQTKDGSYRIIQHTVYDGNDRQVVTTKPARYIGAIGYDSSFMPSGWTVGTAMSSGHLDAYYGGSAGVPDAQGYPYTQTDYSTDPLNRPHYVGNPGADFRIGSGHDIEYLYRSSQSAEVPGFYNLEKLLVINENGQQSSVFTDAFGNKICERQYHSEGKVVNSSGLVVYADLLNSGESIDTDKFTAIGNQQVHYTCTVFQNGTGTFETRFKIGTTPNGGDIYNTTSNDSGSFSATAGSTYYFTSYVQIENGDAGSKARCTGVIEIEERFDETRYQYDIMGNLTAVIPPNAETAGIPAYKRPFYGSITDMSCDVSAFANEYDFHVENTDSFTINHDQVVDYYYKFSTWGSVTDYSNEFKIGTSPGSGNIVNVSTTNTTVEVNSYFSADSGQTYYVTASATMREYEVNPHPEVKTISNIDYEYYNYPPDGSGDEYKPYCTYNEYNTVGQLIKKYSSDADSVRYKYDDNGNLRFMQDGNYQDGGDDLVFYQYDELNRLITVGDATSDHYIPRWKDSLDANITYDGTVSGHPEWDFELAASDGNTKYYVKRVYDAEPPYQQANSPWAEATDPGNLTNLTGRLAADACYDLISGHWSYTYYSYDSYGNIEWIKYDFPGSDIGIKTLAYEYDLQNNVTKLSYQHGNDDAFYFWYDYDEAGRLSSIYADTANVKPDTTTAYYSYWPTGLVKRCVLGKNIQGVDYVYNIRDWLTQINHQNITTYPNTSDPGGDGPGGSSEVEINDRFAEIIGYHNQSHIASDTAFTFKEQHNGNISWLITSTATTNPYMTGFTFSYDGLNRLLEADFGYYNPTGWLQQTANGYDTRDIRYDYNGNFTLLKRYDEIGTLDSLNYKYYLQSNKLKNIAGSPTQNNYTYDSNGNLTGDVAKGISNIYYNYKNLPYRINFQNGKYLKYGYNSNGYRIKKIFVSPE